MTNLIFAPVNNYRLFLWIALFACNVAHSTTAKQDKLREGRDTYLDAYTESHGSPPPYQDYQTQPAGVVYSPQEYDTPYPPSYGSSDPHVSHFYDAPTGPTSPSAPAVYGAPLSPMYGAPYAAPDNGFKGLPVGLNIATLCKILLKVLIFKMIVKFIAVICVLLFFPKLDSGSGSGSASDGDSRLLFNSKGDYSDDRLNALTRKVMESVDNTAKLHIDNECGKNTDCKLSRVAEYIDKHNTVPKLLKLFLMDAIFKRNNERKAR